MIVVDASAIIAILHAEKDHERLAQVLIAAPEKRITPISWLEVTMVLTRKFPNPGETAHNYLRHTAVLIHPIDAGQADWARHAFFTFGKGRHSARLNLSDCFSYAAAKALNAPLLYVGDDFAKTDIRAA